MRGKRIQHTFLAKRADLSIPPHLITLNPRMSWGRLYFTRAGKTPLSAASINFWYAEKRYDIRYLQQTPFCNSRTTMTPWSWAQVLILGPPSLRYILYLGKLRPKEGSSPTALEEPALSTEVSYLQSPEIHRGTKASVWQKTSLRRHGTTQASSLPWLPPISI